MPDAPSTDDPEGDRSRLPSDPETLQAWVRIGMRREIKAKHECDHARKALRVAQQENERLRNECERLEDVLYTLYGMWEHAPSTRSAAEVRADELEQENARLRSELTELKEANASDREADTAERMASAVADAARRGKQWDTGAELKRWLSDRFPFSERTIQRRLAALGLWARPGTRGHTGRAVDDTVENCLEHAG